MENRITKLEEKVNNIEKVQERYGEKIDELSKTHAMFLKIEEQLENFEEKIGMLDDKVDNTKEIINSDKENTRQIINQITKVLEKETEPPEKSVEQIAKEWLVPIVMISIAYMVLKYLEAVVF